MKYISLEDLKKARLQPTCGSQHLTEYAAGQINGWNECIDALKNLAKESKEICGAVLADTMRGICNAIIEALPDCVDENGNIEPEFVEKFKRGQLETADDLDAEFLEALNGGQAESADDLEDYPDCEECRFSGLLTDD